MPCPAAAACHKPASYFRRSADSRPSGPVTLSATTPDPEPKRADSHRRPVCQSRGRGPPARMLPPTQQRPRARAAQRMQASRRVSRARAAPRQTKRLHSTRTSSSAPPYRELHSGKAHTRQPQAPTVTQFPAHAVRASHALARSRPKNSANTPPACLMSSALAGAPARGQGRRPRARTRQRAITISDEWDGNRFCRT